MMNIQSRYLQIFLLLLLTAAGIIFLPPNESTRAAQVAASALQPATELLIFDWDSPVTTTQRGFPVNDPPIVNGNWITPTNFAEGKLHFRAYIRSQPVPQDMRLQFCFWQYNFTLENCASKATVPGVADTAVTWSQNVKAMWKKDGNPMDWANPRQRNGVAIKNSDGLPVSDYLNWNWNGEDPAEWYPLDMRFMVVVVAKGATFGGWQRYDSSITPTPTNTVTNTPLPTFTHTHQPTVTQTATPTGVPTVTPTVTPTETATATPTETAIPAPTPIPLHTPSPTVTPTATSSPTATLSPSLSPSNTPTATATPSRTPIPILTATPTAALNPNQNDSTATPIPIEPTPLVRNWQLLPLIRSPDTD